MSIKTKLQSYLRKLLGVKTGETLGIMTDDEPGYIRITQRDIKGLNMITRDRQLMIVFSLYLKNPFAKAIIDTINDFVFGDGFSYDIVASSDKFPKYKIEQALSVLDNFWFKNNLDLRLEKKGIDLSLNGMLCLPAFVNKQNGEVKLGFVEPLNINKVIYNELNVEDIIAIELKSLTNYQNRQLKVIKINDTDIFSDSYGLLDGECFYFSINNVSNQPEGVSDLLVCADIIDMTESLIFNILKHSEASYEYYQDITLIGANEEQIKKWKKENPRIIDNEARRLVHNDKVKMEYKSPDIKANNSAEIIRTFKNLILLSKRLPEYWFTEGGNTNLATAVEQGTSVFRFLKARQQYWVYILEQILTFVLHQAFIYKKEGFSLTKDDLINNIKIKIIVPEFETKNLEKVAPAIDKITDFLIKGVDNNFITKDEAGKIYRTLPELFGYTVDEAFEAAKLKAMLDINNN